MENIDTYILIAIAVLQFVDGRDIALRIGGLLSSLIRGTSNAKKT